jgi:23S rRNA (pseudouridine1915-N3)-methyltransferase
MQITIAAIGRDRSGPTSELFQLYRKRCPWPVSLVELPLKSIEPAARRLADEADRLTQALPEGAALIALDEQGDDLASQALANRLQGFRDSGRRALGFVIGGPDGLSPDLLARADLRLAFGRQTWPHRLVRAMLAEQIYRAATITTGHPYHRE